jgi:hypothetical protein
MSRFLSEKVKEPEGEPVGSSTSYLAFAAKKIDVLTEEDSERSL